MKIGILLGKHGENMGKTWGGLPKFFKVPNFYCNYEIHTLSYLLTVG
jgi:hypothetical protein